MSVKIQIQSLKSAALNNDRFVQCDECNWMHAIWQMHLQV